MSYILTDKELALWYAGQTIKGLYPWQAFGTEFSKALGEWTADFIPERRNILYGAEVWSQLNRERNIFAYLPKTKWVKSGWRMLTGYATASETDIVLSGETGAIPSSVVPEIQTAKVNPSTLAMSFDISLVYEALVNAGADDMAMSKDMLIKTYAMEFASRINQLLGRKVLADTRTNSVAPATNEIVPLDRIVSGYDESQIGSSATDPIGDYVNVYGLDRATAPSILDSIVVHNNGTAGLSLSFDLFGDLILNKVHEKGGETSVIITGPDTYAKIVALFTNVVTYMATPGDPTASPVVYTSVELGNEGAKPGKEGFHAGWTVPAVFGKPILQSKDIGKDGISRIYGLDLHDPEGYGVPRLSLSVLIPTAYFEVRNPAITGKAVSRGVFLTALNTVSRRLNTHFKIRDLA